MTWLVVIIISVLFAFVLFNWDSIRNMIGKIFKILTPVLFGLAIAYILNPVVDFLGKKLLHKERNSPKVKRIFQELLKKK